MVRRYQHHLILIYFLVLNLVADNNALLSPIKHLLNKVEETRDTSIKTLLKVLPVGSFPKFTKHDLPQSAIDALHSGYENEDIDLNITELIKKNGFPVETHEVVTADGYILNMMRIPSDGTPVFLMHGLFSSSNDWSTNGRYSSLPYLLADKGYDVWMGDARGNHNSRQHVSLDSVKDRKQYWDFSWDEIGRYDLPAMIDHVLDTTFQQDLIYIGHSQGCTSFYVLCSEKPEYNKKISFMLGLSALVFMKHTPSLAMQALTLISYGENSLLTKVVGPELFADDLSDVLKILLCDDATDIVTQLICTSAVFLFFGFNYEQAHYERLPTILKNMAAGSSTKQFIHYAQSISHGEFKQFDYGSSKNEKLYGSETPPDYPLEKVTVPMEIFHGNKDWVNDIRDAKKLLGRLKNSNYTLHDVPNENFAHLDFLFAKDVKTLVYDDVLRLIEEKVILKKKRHT